MLLYALLQTLVMVLCCTGTAVKRVHQVLFGACPLMRANGWEACAMLASLSARP